MPEKRNIEYKQSWHDDYLKWVCGFANAIGGEISGKNEQVTEQVTEQVKKLIQVIEENEYTNAELMQCLDLKHRPTFLYNYQQKALDMNLLEMTIPDKPKSSKQKYRLTEQGRKVKESLKK